MEITGTIHSTYSVTALLVVATVLASALAVWDVLATKMSASAERGGRSGQIIFTSLLASLFLVWLAGEHVPLVQSFAPRSFCFGDIGPLHILAFVLPLLVVAARRVTRHQSATA